MVVPTPAAGQLEARLALEAQLARQQALLASIDQVRPGWGEGSQRPVTCSWASVYNRPLPAECRVASVLLMVA